MIQEKKSFQKLMSAVKLKNSDTFAKLIHINSLLHSSQNFQSHFRNMTNRQETRADQTPRTPDREPRAATFDARENSRAIDYSQFQGIQFQNIERQ